MRKAIFTIMAAFLLISIVAAQQTQPKEQLVCCEQTKSGLFCQNVPESQCESGTNKLPTSCESTSYCKPGTCYDSSEGTCIDHTPMIVCNANNGIWSEEKPPQCELGCCLLGDQAAFVTLVRCKKLSGFFGLKTNFNKKIKSEVQCIMTVLSQEKGACIFDFEFEKTCKFTTRADCESQTTGVKGEFFPGKLCTFEELGTNCAPTTNTICIPGREEVYFVDTCGNPANIYDSSKITDKEYWNNIKSKAESCNPNSGNIESASCGNCNYLLGSYCRPATSKKPTYGTNICADLNCKKTQNGNSYKHGESWCVYNDAKPLEKGASVVGSRFYKHICINGEEVLEQCEDFRQKMCLEDKIETSLGTFSQASCISNRWQDCVLQNTRDDCENTDKRDCIWRQDYQLPALGIIKDKDDYPGGACFPLYPPGLKFWDSEEARQLCSKASVQCIVTYEDKIAGGSKCVSNCECETKEWQEKQQMACTYLGDCGPTINWIGEKGYKSGYNMTRKKQ